MCFVQDATVGELGICGHSANLYIFIVVSDIFIYVLYIYIYTSMYIYIYTVYVYIYIYIHIYTYIIYNCIDLGNSNPMLLMTTTSQTCYRPMSCLLPTSPTLPHTSYCTRNLNQRSPALRRPCSSGFFESMFSFKIGAFGLGTWGTVSKNGKSVALGWII